MNTTLGNFNFLASFLFAYYLFITFPSIARALSCTCGSVFFTILILLEERRWDASGCSSVKSMVEPGILGLDLRALVKEPEPEEIAGAGPPRAVFLEVMLVKGACLESDGC